MRISKIVPWVVLSTLASCSSKEDELAKKRTADLNKNLAQLYLSSVSSLEDERGKTLARTEMSVAWADAGKPQRAKSLLDEALRASSKMKAGPEKDSAVNRVAMAFLRAKFPERTVAMLPSLTASKAKDELQLELIDGYSATGEYELAEALITKLKGEDLQLEGRARMLVALATAGQVDKALKQVSSLKTKARASRVFLAAVKTQVRRGKYAEARQLLQSMEGGTDRNHAQAALALALFRANKTGEAQKLLDGIESIWIRAVARVKFSNHLYQSRTYKDAQTRGDKAMEEIQEISDADVKEAAVEELADLFLQEKRTKEALQLARMAQTKEGLIGIQSDLVEAYARAGRFDETKKLIPGLIQEPIWGADGLGRLAQIYAEDGQYLGALQTAKSIAIMEFRIPVLAKLAVMHEQAGLKLTDEVLTAFEAAMTVKP